MTSDPLQRLREARPPLPDWTSSPDGRDQWQVTERRGLDGTFPTGAGPTPRPRRTRWLGLLAAAALLVSGTAVATAAITRPTVTGAISSAPRGYELPIIGLRTGAAGRSLIVNVISTPCLQSNRRARAVETATTVTVIVTYDPVPATRPSPGCPQLPSFTLLTAPLDDTLGFRVVRDGTTGRTLHPFDGTTLLRPTWLPSGYRLTFEDGDSESRSWYQSWTVPTRPYFYGSFKAPCLSRLPDIAVNQGPPLNRTGMGYVTLPGRITIDGVPATLTRSRRGQTFLSWSPPNLPAGQAVVVSSESTCFIGQTPYLPVSTLLHVARSLR